MPHPRFDLLALDLDDTLLTEELTISEADRAAVRAAENAGVRVVLATGRGPDGMRRFWPLLEMNTRPSYAVAYNGALVLRTDTGEKLFEEKLPSDLALELARACDSAGYAVQTYRDGAIYVSRENAWTTKDSWLTELPNIVTSMANIASPDPVKLVVPADPETLPAFAEKLRASYGGRANFIISKPYFMEILPKNADKGIALAHLAGILGVPRERVMAVGDAMNDAGMLEWAGFGVAMANAFEPVKKLAKAVTTRDHNSDGVAEAIERWILS